ncbi:hypothetical protein SAMN02745121_05409 [Nannocystis exedens]|uniref:Uncharacterized protein n=1 Tax=Nannocystis exedens TaxID=54 RepID=A0A1I2D683_9BACT|nr:hypothetical protein [Nannocystis exedens]PCC70706.1 hypothetical protein NAEX_03770 [Nannocystis exedens]SFE76028.1 hypothetical protein SAMN02745121_05409 [Nannocystis exedens]
MRRALLLAITLTGCGPGVLDPILTTTIGFDTSGPADTTALDTAGPPPEATSGASMSSTSGPSASSSAPDTSITTGIPDDCTFVCLPTTGEDGSFIMPPVDVKCDVWAQDCPAGQKCAVAGPPPLDTDSIACTTLVPEPDQLGEPCQVLVEGHLGPDTCDLGLYCHDVDPRSQKGTCIPLCTGDLDDPTCPLGQVCMDLALPLCLAACDPLLPTCPAGESCAPLSSGFGCWPDSGSPKRGLFEVCESFDQCADGLFCDDPAGAGECDLDELGCCLPLCDLNSPDTCPGLELHCQPFYQDGPPPAGLEHLGVCSLP